MLFWPTLCRYGGCAEVVTDQGREYQGEFDELLTDHFIHHRTTSSHHPQANGQAERFVQTIKHCMNKTIQGGKDPLLWEVYTQYALLGYRVTPHAATGFSPYQLLNAQMPTLPSAIREKVYDAIDFDADTDQERENIAQHLVKRAALVERQMVMAGQGIKIAQERDTLRYARVHGGGIIPKLRMLICDGCRTGWHKQCSVPPLTRVPRGNWFCPACSVRGRQRKQMPKQKIPARLAEQDATTGETAQLVSAGTCSNSYTKGKPDYPSSPLQDASHRACTIVPRTEEEAWRLRTVEDVQQVFSTVTGLPVSPAEAYQMFHSTQSAAPKQKAQPNDLHALHIIDFSNCYAAIDLFASHHEDFEALTQESRVLHLYTNKVQGDFNLDQFLPRSYHCFFHDNKIDLVFMRPCAACWDLILPLVAWFRPKIIVCQIPHQLNSKLVQWFRIQQQAGRLKFLISEPNGEYQETTRWVIWFQQPQLQHWMITAENS
jgi:hypothetical protein